MKIKILSIALASTLALAGLASATQDKWIHIKVSGHDDEEVTVNLPLALVTAAAALIPEDVDHEIQVSLDEVRFDWKELRTFWQAVKDAPEATFVTVQTRDEKIEVKKMGDFVLVNTLEHSAKGADVNVRFPMAVVDALLSGPEGKFDFEAALKALAEHDDGHLVSVHDGKDTVNIWIDDRNAAE